MNREANPFVAASKIDFDGPFIGRKDDLKYIVLQMEAAQPTSINIVGDKKLGKSCLLYRFSQVWEHHLIGKSDKYVVIYLSCENVLESHENSFYQHIAENLCASSHVAKDSELFAAMQVDDWTRENFNRAI
ncbi:MAG: TniB family NTP-binding protein, partial [Candidatus Marithrix sp.]|nr:TniB family NTP-binding protein [Candidatus Marithrix sp.]